MRVTLLTAALLLGAFAHTASAQIALPDERTTYRLEGNDSERGPFTSWVTIDPDPGIEFIEVIRHVAYDSDPDTRHMQRGYGSVDGATLKVKLRDRVGAIGTIEGREANATDFFLNIQPDGQMDTLARSAQGHSNATGYPVNRRTEEPRAEALGPRILQRGKHLVAVAEDALRKHLRKEGEKLLYDQHGIEEEFGVSDYLHVGIGGKVHPLKPEELNAEQQFASRRRPFDMWITSEVYGGVRVPLSSSIPVGEGVTVSVGLQPGARVGYTVTDLYPVPRDWTREELLQAIAGLEHVAKRSFDLPLDASEAEAMTVGASRVFDGQARVAINGSIGFGYDIGDIQDVLQIGATARLGGFYRVSGDMRITVERLIGSRVRVRVRQGDTTSHGVHASLLVGATLKEGWVREKIEPGIEYLDEALIKLDKLPDNVREEVLERVEDEVVDRVTGTVRKVVRLKIHANSRTTDREEVDISWIVDLNSGSARAAYEKAVRGDFRELGSLSLEPDSGVNQEFRVLEAEEHTHFSAGLQLSILLDAHYSHDIRVSDLVVENGEGTTNYEIFRYDRNQGFNLFGGDSYEKLTAEVIRRERDGQIVRSLRMTVDIYDEHTFKWEGVRVQRMIRHWGLDSHSDVPTPEFELFRSRFRKTRLQIRVAIDDAGLRFLKGVRDTAAFDAYANGFAAIEGKVPVWSTPSGKWAVERDEHEDVRQYRLELEELDAAKEFVAALRALRLATTKGDRAQALKRLANSAEFDHYVLTALLSLVPRENVDLDASFMGKRIRVVDARGGDLSPVSVDRP